MRISDWSSDVCSSDLLQDPRHRGGGCQHGDHPALGVWRGVEEQRRTVAAADRGAAREGGARGLRSASELTTGGGLPQKSRSDASPTGSPTATAPSTSFSPTT